MSNEEPTEQDGRAEEISDEIARKYDPERLLRMIAKREAALAQKNGGPRPAIRVERHHSADNANEAMRILNIAEPDPGFGGSRWKLNAWATQAALSRPGKRKLTEVNVRNIRFFTFDAETLHWPRGRVG